ncbi:MAG: type II toxin-antitoxin system VapC family toxin [Bradymonadales bacterium]|nr:type II toxin-antitoxin system VapC family toxin [Bradymonadales bacterium]
MRLLLDTHILIWLAEGISDLPKPSIDAIQASAAESGLAVSGISFWEIAMLAERGRITLSQPLNRWRARVLEVPGMLEAPVDGEVGIEAVRLPGQFHADPADRFLVATARIFGFRLGTRDQRLLEYAAAGHLNATPL